MTVRDALGAAREALHAEQRRAEEAHEKCDSLAVAIVVFLSHPSVADPDGRFMGLLDRGSVAIKASDGVPMLPAPVRVAAASAAWRAMLGVLVKELRK